MASKKKAEDQDNKDNKSAQFDPEQAEGGDDKGRGTYQFDKDNSEAPVDQGNFDASRKAHSASGKDDHKGETMGRKLLNERPSTGPIGTGGTVK